MTRLRMLAALTSLAVLAAGCVAGESPGLCDDATVNLNATLTDSSLEPSSLEACRDQRVTLNVTTETVGVFHLHGYDEEAPAAELAAGETLTLEFDATRAGEFEIELHPAGGDEVTVGTFTVHEP